MEAGEQNYRCVQKLLFAGKQEGEQTVFFSEGQMRFLAREEDRDIFNVSVTLLAHV